MVSSGPMVCIVGCTTARMAPVLAWRRLPVPVVRRILVLTIPVARRIPVLTIPVARRIPVPAPVVALVTWGLARDPVAPFATWALAPVLVARATAVMVATVAADDGST